MFVLCFKKTDIRAMNLSRCRTFSSQNHLFFFLSVGAQPSFGTTPRKRAAAFSNNKSIVLFGKAPVS
jgi:hypothetical protein